MLIALGMGLSGRELDKMMASRHGTHQVGTDEVTTPTSNAAGDAVSAMLIGSEPEEEEEEKPSYRSNASVVPQDGTILSCAGSNDASSSGGPSVTQLPPAKPPPVVATSASPGGLQHASAVGREAAPVAESGQGSRGSGITTPLEPTHVLANSNNQVASGSQVQQHRQAADTTPPAQMSQVHVTIEPDPVKGLLRCLFMQKHVQSLTARGFEGVPGLLKLLSISEANEVRQLLPPSATDHQRLSLVCFWKHARKLAESRADAAPGTGSRLECAVQAMVYEGLFVRGEAVSKASFDVIQGLSSINFRLRISASAPLDERCKETIRTALVEVGGQSAVVDGFSQGARAAASASVLLRCSCTPTSEWSLPQRLAELGLKGSRLAGFEILPTGADGVRGPKLDGFRVTVKGTNDAIGALHRLAASAHPEGQPGGQPGRQPGGGQQAPSPAGAGSGSQATNGGANDGSGEAADGEAAKADMIARVQLPSHGPPLEEVLAELGCSKLGSLLELAGVDLSAVLREAIVDDNQADEHLLLLAPSDEALGRLPHGLRSNPEMAKALCETHIVVFRASDPSPLVALPESGYGLATCHGTTHPVEVEDGASGPDDTASTAAASTAAASTAAASSAADTAAGFSFSSDAAAATTQREPPPPPPLSAVRCVGERGAVTRPAKPFELGIVLRIEGTLPALYVHEEPRPDQCWAKAIVPAPGLTVLGTDPHAPLEVMATLVHHETRQLVVPKAETDEGGGGWVVLRDTVSKRNADGTPKGPGSTPLMPVAASAHADGIRKVRWAKGSLAIQHKPPDQSNLKAALQKAKTEAERIELRKRRDNHYYLAFTLRRPADGSTIASTSSKVAFVLRNSYHMVSEAEKQFRRMYNSRTGGTDGEAGGPPGAAIPSGAAAAALLPGASHLNPPAMADDGGGASGARSGLRRLEVLQVETAGGGPAQGKAAGGEIVWIHVAGLTGLSTRVLFDKIEAARVEILNTAEPGRQHGRLRVMTPANNGQPPDTAESVSVTVFDGASMARADLIFTYMAPPDRISGSTNVSARDAYMGDVVSAAAPAASEAGNKGSVQGDGMDLLMMALAQRGDASGDAGDATTGEHGAMEKESAHQAPPVASAYDGKREAEADSPSRRSAKAQKLGD